MTDPTQRAAEFFTQGYSCSQSLLCAFCESYGLDEATAFKLASPFGGGIARLGKTCGAVTGALMVLGLNFGPHVGEKNDQAYNLAQEFMVRFQKQHATIECSQLIRFDLSQEDQLLAARESGVFQSICPTIVQSAAGIVDEMLHSRKILQNQKDIG